MRVLVLLVAISNVAVADPDHGDDVRLFHALFGLGRTLEVDPHNVRLIRDIELGYVIDGAWEVMLGVGSSTAKRRDKHGQAAPGHEVRAGIGRVHCSRYSCAGWIGTLGIDHSVVEVPDLTDWAFQTERELFLEWRGLLRVRLGRYLALEASFGLRAQYVHLEFCDPGCNDQDLPTSPVAVLGGIGIHVTI